MNLSQHQIDVIAVRNGHTFAYRGDDAKALERSIKRHARAKAFPWRFASELIRRIESSRQSINPFQ